jgi:hypothetical protein
MRSIPVLCLLIASLLFACSSEEPRSNDADGRASMTPSNPSEATTSEAPNEGRDMGRGPAPGDPVDSVRSMVEWHSNAVIASVGDEVSATELDPAAPYTVYQLSVEEVLFGELVKVGDLLPLAIWGGTTSAGFSAPLDGPLQPGQRYLVFLADLRLLGLPGYMGDSRARFELSDDGHVMTNGSESSAGARMVSGVSEEEYRSAVASGNRSPIKGQTVEQAKELILQAVAEAPLPDPPWLRDGVKPAPTERPLDSPAPNSPSPAPGAVVPGASTPSAVP